MSNLGNKQTMAQNILYFMNLHGKTRYDMCEALGVKYTTFTDWVKAKSYPRIDKIELMANYFGVSKSDLVEEMQLTAQKLPEIMTYYNTLNDMGKQEATKRVEELTYISKYVDPSAPLPPAPTRIINYYYRLASAGSGQIVFDTPPTQRIEIPDTPQNRRVDYAIGVNGESMEPMYHDGDMLLVEMTESISKGEIGIFLVNGESFVKKLGDTELISLNKGHSNIPLNESARCLGRVIGTLPVKK